MHTHVRMTRLFGQEIGYRIRCPMWHLLQNHQAEGFCLVPRVPFQLLSSIVNYIKRFKLASNGRDLFFKRKSVIFFA